MFMTDDLIRLSWPLERLGEALEALARRSKLSVRPASIDPLGRLTTLDDQTLGEWIRAAASRLDLEAEEVFSSYAELEQMILAGGPALLRLRLGEETRFLVLVGPGGRTVSVLDVQLSERKVAVSLICSALRSPLESKITSELDVLLKNLGVPPRQRTRTRRAILNQRLGAVPISGFWLLRLTPGSGFSAQLQNLRSIRDIVVLTIVHALQYALWILSWWVVGRGALQGRLDYAWLLAWALLLLTIIPLRLLTTWMQGALAIRVGGLLKRRLLYGALRLDPEQMRHQGTGQLLGRIIETEAVESLALSGGFLGLLAGIELLMAAVVLSAGSGGWLHAGLLLLWTIMTVFIGWKHFNKRRHWTKERVRLTNDLVERMVGHRTRLAQEPRERWHEAEDHSLENYFATSARMDRISIFLSAFVPRGWLVIGILGLASAFIQGSTTTALAVGLGGTLLAYSALRRLSAGIAQLVDASIAWQQAAPLFHAANDPKFSLKPAMTSVNGLSSALENGAMLLDAHDLAFRHNQRSAPVIKRCDLRIRAGDKVLLEGPSGGGKSTLVSLFVGLRQPDSGLLLLRGFDRRTLGDEHWRRLIVSAPQFHENHVMTETFAFNLLMGRRWPAWPSDLEECETVCRELGLGELIDRMPAGLHQMVGETGWQLSHGERSRLYIARAILQHADLVVLDESFAALDPENLRRALTSVLNRAPTVMVIAHP